MRLPFLQIAHEVLNDARELATRLGSDEFRMGWGLVRLFDWALDRCPEDRPPSASNVVLDGPAGARPGTGPEPAGAAALIAAAAGWSGDAEAYVDACSMLPQPLLERVGGGIRVCGLSRYDAAWGKNRPKQWAEWKLKHAKDKAKAKSATQGRNRNGTGPEPLRTSDGPASKPAGSASSDADADADAGGGGGGEESFAAAEETAPLPAAEEITSRARASDRGWKESALWAAYGAEYASRGLYVERAKPKGWRAHVATAREQNFSLGQLVGALREFLEDSRPASEGGLKADTRSLALFFEPGIWGRRVKPDPTPDRLEDLSPAAQAFAERLDRMAAEGASYGAAYLRQLEPVELREDGQLVVQGDKYQLAWFQGVYAEWADRLGLLVQLSPDAVAFAERLEKIWPTRDGTGP